MSTHTITAALRGQVTEAVPAEVSLVVVSSCARQAYASASIAGVVSNDNGNIGRDIPEGVTAAVRAFGSDRNMHSGETMIPALLQSYHISVEVLHSGSIASCRIAA